MRKTITTALAALALGIGAAAVHAQDQTAPKTSAPPATMNHDAMMGGDMAGMMKMMGQMSEMMEQCKTMMQGMNAHPPAPPKSPLAPPGGKKG